MDTLTSMRCFAAVVRARSFAAAARQLELAPATVTKHVQRLEGRIGVRLLQRTTRSVSLTEAGEFYYEHCHRALAQLEYAEAEAGALGRRPRGCIRVTAPYDFGVAELEPALLEFMARFPEIMVELILTARFVELIDEQVDLALRISATSLDPSLVARRLSTSRLLVCASPSYLAGRRPRAPRDLARHNCLLYSNAGWQKEWPFRAGGKTQHVSLSGTLRANDNRLLCRAAAAGMGVTIQPSFNVWQELREGRLERVLEPWTIGELGVYAVFPNRTYLPSKVRVLVDFLAARYSARRNQDTWLQRATQRA